MPMQQILECRLIRTVGNSSCNQLTVLIGAKIGLNIRLNEIECEAIPFCAELIQH